MKRFRRTIKGNSITVPEMSISLRTIMDKACHGEPINTALRQHKPLPPDNASEEDFETGTREIIDLNDIHQLQQEIEAKVEEQKKKQDEVQQKKKDEAFARAVDDEIKRRESEAVTQQIKDKIN